MDVRDDYVYTPEHEWAKVDGDEAVFGLSAYAVEQLGGITFIDLPDSGNNVTQGDAFAEIESVKAVSDIYAPASGTIQDVNDDLNTNPELIDQDPYGDGWICKVTLEDTNELDDLMSADDYADFLEDAE